MWHGPALLLSLTLGAYATGVVLQRLGRQHPLLNPTLIAIGIVAGALVLFRVDYGGYFLAVQPIHVLLGPAVVALAYRSTAACRCFGSVRLCLRLP